MLSTRTRWCLLALLVAVLIYHFEPVVLFTSHGFDGALLDHVRVAYNSDPRRYVEFATMLAEAPLERKTPVGSSNPFGLFNINDRDVRVFVNASLQGNDHLLDKRLHKLSGWHWASERFFKSYVEDLISEYTDAVRHLPYLFLELGCGTGAFARHLLRAFPNAVVIGGDIHMQSTSMANFVLRDYRQQRRFQSVYWDLTALNATYLFHKLEGRVDHVFFSGSLCYLDRLSQIHDAIQQTFRLVKPGGLISVSMLPDNWFGKGSCASFIPRKYFLDMVQCGCIQAKLFPFLHTYIPRYSAVFVKNDMASAPCESACVIGWGTSSYKTSRLFWRTCFGMCAVKMLLLLVRLSHRTCFGMCAVKMLLLLVRLSHRILVQALHRLKLSFPSAKSVDSLLHLLGVSGRYLRRGARAIVLDKLSFPSAEFIDALLHHCSESEHYIWRSVRAFVFDAVILGIIIMRLLPRW